MFKYIDGGDIGVSVKSNELCVLVTNGFVLRIPEDIG